MKSPLCSVILFLTVLIVACDEDECINGNRQIDTIAIDDLPVFSGIDFAGGADITMTKGSESRVQITGETNIIDLFTFRVSGSDLVIESRECYSATEPINILLTTPALNRILHAGSGNLFSSDRFSGNTLELALSGSGNISLRHRTLETATIDLAGSGNIALQGEAQQAVFSIEGSGNIEAFGYSLRQGEVVIRGSGNCSVSVEETLSILIEGSGNVFFKGNPAITTTIRGSGDVIDAN